jgi:hypothetical protein
VKNLENIWVIWRRKWSENGKFSQGLLGAETVKEWGFPR